MTYLEVWRSIEYAPYFAISNKGRVQALLSGEVMAEEVDEDEGLVGVFLTDERGQYFFVPIDILVVEAFIGPTDDMEEIHHIDGDPWNNEVWNLRPCLSWWTDCNDCE